MARVEARLKEKKVRNSLKATRDTAAETAKKQALELNLSAEDLRQAITAKEQAANDRSALEDELQTIFAHAPICLFLTDGEARLYKANPAVVELFGTDAESLPINLPDHFGFEKSPISPPKRSNRLFCKFEIISEEMAGNGAFGNLAFPLPSSEMTSSIRNKTG